MKLYQFSLSPNAKRIRVMAGECGAPCEIVELDWQKGEHKAPAFLAKNPNGKVPTIEDGNVTLWESPAILMYLAKKYESKGLFPQSATDQAEAVRWMFWNASHLEPQVFTTALEKMFKPMMGGQTDQARIAACQIEFDRFAAVLNGRLEGREWLCGPFSIADICVGTTVEFGASAPVGLNFAPYRHVQAWLSRLQKRATWQKAG